MCDEDLVRPESSIQHTTEQQQHQLLGKKETPKGIAMAAAAAADLQPGAAVVPLQLLRPGSGSPAPNQSVEQLLEAAHKALAEGQASNAARLLQAALARCPLARLDLATQIVELLLRAEHELCETPLGSRSGTEALEVEANVEGGSALPAAAAAMEKPGSSEAARELRYALEALANSEPRRALQHLAAADVACPPHGATERRRIELWRLLVATKRHL